jgi:hypothetical protein
VKKISLIFSIFGSGEACYVRDDEIDDFRRRGDGGLRYRRWCVTLKMLYIIQALSGLETHRSNEWEGNRGSTNTVHAARDIIELVIVEWNKNIIIRFRTPSFRLAPNVGKVFLHWVAIGACETHLPAESNHNYFWMQMKKKVFFLFA